ncbi:MAG: hypothetical protein NVV82_09630 [Sporocytophaga sp.]|nr:hypothetical protein [Sporocytophaga sp.]
MKRLGLFIISLFIFFMVSCSSGTYVGRTYTNSYGYDYYPYSYYNYDPSWNNYGGYYPYSDPFYQNYNYGYGWNYYPYNYRYYHNYDRSINEMW